MIQTFNPHDGAPVFSAPAADDTVVDKVCRRAREVFFRDWRVLEAERRAEALASVAAHLRERAADYALAETRDTGKPQAAALGEVAGAAALWDYAASLARVQRSDALGASTREGLAFTLREPMGVVGLIVPWNYPLITTAERLPFALAAGCCVVLKPSELAVGSLPMLLEHLSTNPLLPDGVVQALFGTGKETGLALTRHPAVDMIAFVGSTSAGRAIESSATANGKRVSAELGGSNLVLVYPDADLPRAAEAVAASALRNGGQACIAGTHVLVDPAVADRFAALVNEVVTRDYSGLDAQGRPRIQPMITFAHKQRLAGVVNTALAGGACAMSASQLDLPGNYYGPVLLDGLAAASALRRQELFGPVITFTRMTADKFPAEIADNAYGLAVYLWTASTAAALSAARHCRVGRVWINADPGFWLPELPVGGFAGSGTGREGGFAGLETYSLSKSVLLY
ncbi:aldehyde dehydrogenase family protein [uncultured Aquitalea sp.]|uniref:aldehyde dehydrogenase family protein n=1 Tax=uncultured Aquitalea sp. TaxID=540272 RepID=UPI0025E81DA0|nr:aldehyde dehydrogenase family protein [uncultured Aquitalea sp.]